MIVVFEAECKSVLVLSMCLIELVATNRKCATASPVSLVFHSPISLWLSPDKTPIHDRTLPVSINTNTPYSTPIQTSPPVKFRSISEGLNQILRRTFWLWAIVWPFGIGPWKLTLCWCNQFYILDGGHQRTYCYLPILSSWLATHYGSMGRNYRNKSSHAPQQLYLKKSKKVQYWESVRQQCSEIDNYFHQLPKTASMKRRLKDPKWLPEDLYRAFGWWAGS